MGHFHTPYSIRNVPVNQVSWSHIKNVLRKWPKTSKISIFTYVFVIEDPLKKIEQKIKILLAQLYGQYCCAHSSQISARSHENREPIRFEKWLTDGRRTVRHQINSNDYVTSRAKNIQCILSILATISGNMGSHGRHWQWSLIFTTIQWIQNAVRVRGGGGGGGDGCTWGLLTAQFFFLLAPAPFLSLFFFSQKFRFWVEGGGGGSGVGVKGVVGWLGGSYIK